MADTSDVIKKISDLGLTETESRLYHYLLVSGTVSIMRLSKDLNIPRTTIYRMCEKLVKKNFLEWVVERQGTRVKALSPDQLGTLLQEKRTEVKKMADAISKFMLNKRWLDFVIASFARHPITS